MGISMIRTGAISRSSLESFKNGGYVILIVDVYINTLK